MYWVFVFKVKVANKPKTNEKKNSKHLFFKKIDLKTSLSLGLKHLPNKFLSVKPTNKPKSTRKLIKKPTIKQRQDNR